MAGRIEHILREGFDDFRRYVNPLVALRAELLGEPVRCTHTADGRLVEDRGEVEDFHGTQAFGYRNPAITAAVRELLDSDAPNWLPSRVNPWGGVLARRLCERANDRYRQLRERVLRELRLRRRRRASSSPARDQ
jgi:ornithine--oxo-acid transaminase/putrescine aminotransferase